MRKSLLLLALAMLAAVIVSVAVLLHAARVQDDEAAARSRDQVGVALRAETARLAEIVRDNAIWNEAFGRVGPPHDFDWMEATLTDMSLETIRATTFLVVGPDGGLYRRGLADGIARADKGRVPVPAWAASFVEAVRAADEPTKGHRDGLVLVDGLPVAVAASVVASESGEVTGGMREAPVLIFARALNTAGLKDIQETAGVKDLRFGFDGGVPEGAVGIALTGFDGRPAGWLTWTLHKPGRDLVAHSAPWLALANLGILAVTAALLLRIAATSRALVAANGRLKAANEEIRLIGDAAPLPLGVVRHDTGDFLFANMEMRALLGLAGERPEGVSIQTLFQDHTMFGRIQETDPASDEILILQTTVEGAHESFPAEVTARWSVVGGDAVLILTVRDLRPAIDAARIRRIAEERLLRVEAERTRTNIIEMETRLLRPVLFDMVGRLVATESPREMLAVIANAALRAMREQAVVYGVVGRDGEGPVELAIDNGMGVAVADVLSPLAAALEGEGPDLLLLTGAPGDPLPVPAPFRTVVAIGLHGLSGALIVASEEPEAFTDGDVAVLKALAGSIVVALRGRAAPPAPRRRMRKAATPG